MACEDVLADVETLVQLDDQRETLIQVLTEIIREPRFGPKVQRAACALRAELIAVRPRRFIEQMERERGLR